MESAIRQGQPGLRQDILIYGKQYKLWRDGIFIGIATWSEDKFIGDAFLQTEGDKINVFEADEWELT